MMKKIFDKKGRLVAKTDMKTMWVMDFLLPNFVTASAVYDAEVWEKWVNDERGGKEVIEA